MNRQLKFALGLSVAMIACQATAADIVFYEGEGFRGRMFATNQPVRNLHNAGFRQHATSVTVESGRWEVCESISFGGRCAILRRGSYDSPHQMGIHNGISSVRPVSNRNNYSSDRYSRPEPLEEPAYEYRRRRSERLVDVPVTSVRAVVGAPEERCWMERQEIERSRSGPNVGGAIAGALLGGILGHQVGDGRGKDLATAGGAVAGGAIGANVGRNRRGGYEEDVRRCETVASTTPEYWDVTYDYRGIEHRVQMSEAPGRTISVNRNGEPRG